MEQFEQLLTCAICLDRYRNPKLLPCQHSFCMEPCMDGLVDYVRRQVKCPECRAEHRIPYQGVQAFPTNVTLQRFLELHIEITGELPDPTSGQTMERCGVCSEKSYCSLCVHCEKKCCPECKDAHMDILRREIARINSQVRRGLHRLQDALALVEKNTLGLQTNCASVSEEVDEIYRRLSKALKDRTEHLRNEIDRYLGAELRGLIQLKENLELEIANIQSNCDLAEAHINENVPWDDSELLDTKELFLRTVEFIRNFEYEAGDYSRRVRFVMAHDPNQLVLHVAGYGELNIKPEAGTGGLLGSSSSLAAPGNSPGLMRSKSDHRLASQYRQQEEERLARNRYVPDYEYDAPEYEVSRNKSRYRSRFMRHRDGEDSDGDSRSTVRFTSTPQDASSMRERVLDTEDAARGPLSGIFRLTDSPRVMKKLQECERAGKRKKEEPATQQTPSQPAKPQVQVKKAPTAVARQVSEDDEISRIKKQNKNAAVPSAEPTEDRAQVPLTPVHQSAREMASEPDDSVRRTPITRRTSVEAHSPSTRSASSDSSTGSESSTGSGIRSTGAPFSAEEMKQKYLSRAPATNTTTTITSGQGNSTTAGKPSSSAPPPARPFQSRFLGTGNRAAPPPPTQATREEPASKKKEEEDEDEETSSSSEETESETEEESENESHPTPATPPASSLSTTQERQRNESAMAKTDIGPLLARSAEARRGSKEESPSTRYTTPRGSPALSVSSPTTTTTPTTTTAATGSAAAPLTSPGGYTSRFVANVDHADRHGDMARSYSSNPPNHDRSRKFSDDATPSVGINGDTNVLERNASSSPSYPSYSTSTSTSTSSTSSSSFNATNAITAITPTTTTTTITTATTTTTTTGVARTVTRADDSGVTDFLNKSEPAELAMADSCDRSSTDAGSTDGSTDTDETDIITSTSSPSSSAAASCPDDGSVADRLDAVDGVRHGTLADIFDQMPHASLHASEDSRVLGKGSARNVYDERFLETIEEVKDEAASDGSGDKVDELRDDRASETRSESDGLLQGDPGKLEMIEVDDPWIELEKSEKAARIEGDVELEVNGRESDNDVEDSEDTKGHIKLVLNDSSEVDIDEALEAKELPVENGTERSTSENEAIESSEAREARHQSSEAEDDELVLTGQLNIRFENNPSSKERYEDAQKRWSKSSLTDEKSIEELFDENGWMVTDQDLQTERRPSVSLFKRSSESDTDTPPPNPESSPSAESSIECIVTDVKQSVSKSSDSSPRNKIYRQSSIGKDGWQISDESEPESGRGTSPSKTENPSESERELSSDKEIGESNPGKIQESPIASPRDPLKFTSPLVNHPGGREVILDENGWVIVNNNNNNTSGGKHVLDERRKIVVNGAKGARRSHLSNSKLRERCIENGALVRSATQSKDKKREGDDPLASQPNLSVSMQMVTTVFCVSILCYSVLINLFL